MVLDYINVSLLLLTLLFLSHAGREAEEDGSRDKEGDRMMVEAGLQNPKSGQGVINGSHQSHKRIRRRRKRTGKMKMSLVLVAGSPPLQQQSGQIRRIENREMGRG